MCVFPVWRLPLQHSSKFSSTGKHICSVLQKQTLSVLKKKKGFLKLKLLNYCLFRQNKRPWIDTIRDNVAVNCGKFWKNSSLRLPVKSSLIQRWSNLFTGGATMGCKIWQRKKYIMGCAVNTLLSRQLKVKKCAVFEGPHCFALCWNDSENTENTQINQASSSSQRAPSPFPLLQPPRWWGQRSQALPVNSSWIWIFFHVVRSRLGNVEWKASRWNENT